MENENTNNTTPEVQAQTSISPASDTRTSDTTQNSNTATPATESSSGGGLKDKLLEILKGFGKKDDAGEGDNKGDNKNTEAPVQTPDNPFRDASKAATDFMEVVSKQDATLELKDVVAPTTMAETAIKQMENVNMSKLIGAPINAAVEAQFDAARKMLDCIQQIGLKDNTLAVVTFNFFKNGKQATMTVPLLTLVPINAMRIKEMTYSFKLKIDTESSVNLQTGAENTISYGTNIKGGDDKKAAPAGEKDPKADKAGGAKTAEAVKNNAVQVEPTFATSFSSKKDSKATQNSKYSVETSMDISLTVAPEENMPGGISRMLEILNNTIDVHNPNGELTVKANRVSMVDGVAVTNVSYINGEGNYDPGKVTCKKMGSKEGDSKVLAMNNGEGVDLLFLEEGMYVVSAEKLQSYVIVDKEAKPAPKAEDPKPQSQNPEPSNN